MPLQSFLIAPTVEGLVNNVPPWLLPDDAFETLEDAYVWRQRIKKRFGYSLIGTNDLTSRLRVNLGNTDSSGNFSGTVPGATFAIGQSFSIGSAIFTVYQAGASNTITAITQANPGEVTTSGSHGFSTGQRIYFSGVGGMTQLNGNTYTITVTAVNKFTIGVNTSGFGAFTVGGNAAPALLSTTSASGSYSTANGALVITGATAATPVFFYPATPVMGLLSLNTAAVSINELIGFDTQFAYRRVGGAWTRSGSLVWTGQDYNFFWGCNYRGTLASDVVLYVVNNVVADQISYYNRDTDTWTRIRPQLDTTTPSPLRYLETSLLLVPFKSVLVAFNTQETTSGVTKSYPNRARWCQDGVPNDPAVSWVDTVPGRGGFLDAPTTEAIISCKVIKDRLIVYFESSTWEFVSTGDAAFPFFWQQLNVELGVESSFSIVGFDKGAIGVGNVGIHTCNGVSVNRIDEKIPNEVFKIHNDGNGPLRVYGIRDFYNELVYWAFPTVNNATDFPDRILVWNYQNNTWAFFNDSFTCFGYYQSDSTLKWSDLGDLYGTWQNWQASWDSSANQFATLSIVAGNQEGFVFVINNDKSSNSQALYITDMTAASTTLTVVNHNLESGDYILIEDCVGITSLNGTIVKVGGPITANTFTIDEGFSGTYLGGGKITRISNINIKSKEWCPGVPVGQQFRIPYLDLLMVKTDVGEFCIDYIIDTTGDTSIQDQVSPGVLLGDNTVRTYPENNVNYQELQDKIWHRYYTMTQGQFIQIQMFMNEAQMKDYDVATSDWQLEAINLYVEPQGRIIG